MLLLHLATFIHLPQKLNAKESGLKCCHQTLKQNQPQSTYFPCCGLTALAPSKSFQDYLIQLQGKALNNQAHAYIRSPHCALVQVQN